MKFSSWLDALRSGPSRRPIRRSESHGLLRKSANGKLSVEQLNDRIVPAFLTPVDHGVGAYPQAVVAGYFNSDAILDLATANYSDSTVSVLLGNPDGTFHDAVSSSTGTYPLGSYPFSLAVGDFDGDTVADLATTNAYGLSVLLGNGDGTFQPASAISVGTNPTSLAVGDFNDDGNLDLGVTSNTYVVDYYGYYGSFGHYEGQVEVLLGNGDASFAAPVGTPLGSGYHQGAVAADFNGDGKDDFATTDGYSNVNVLLGNPDGSGNLLHTSDNATGWYPHSVAVGDFNGDGVSDLVTRNDSSISVLMGNGSGGIGDGTFQSSQSLNTDYYTTSVAVGDFNHDGKLDVGAASNVFVVDYYGYYGAYGHYEPQAKVLLGYGNGHFTAPETTALGTGWVSGIASGNFDGNGFSDLAVTNSGNNNLSVLINDQSWAPLPPPSVSINDVTVTEGNSGSTNATFTLSLAFAHTADVTVHYATANDSAAAGSDYTGASGDVTFLAGQTTKTINVAVLGDRVGESTETFAVNLTSAVAPIGDGQGIGTILDDEPRISISDAAYVTEGNTGSTNATFTVNLSMVYDQDVTVHYATANGSATAGSDYTGVSDATVTIAAGNTSQTFPVAVLGDRLAESTETFSVNLSGATNSLITASSATGTILDNEPRITINDVSKAEGTINGNKNNSPTSFVFTVSLSASYDQAVTVNYSTADGSAKVSDYDYTAKSGTLTFAAGETSKTVTILVIPDKKRETNEWFALNLSGPSTNAFLLDNQGFGTILDDDTHGRR